MAQNQVPTEMIEDEAVTTGKIADGALSADATGRAKMADGYLSADATGRAKMADGFADHTKVAAGAQVQLVAASSSALVTGTTVIPTRASALPFTKRYCWMYRSLTTVDGHFAPVYRAFPISAAARTMACLTSDMPSSTRSS